MASGDDWRPPADWRELLAHERGLVDALVSQDFPAAAQLRRQLDHALARQGCGCGCGTIDIVVDRELIEPAAVARQPTQGEAEVLDAEGNVVGGLILFAGDGYLSSLEIYSAGGAQPLPALADVRPFVV